MWGRGWVQGSAPRSVHTVLHHDLFVRSAKFLFLLLFPPSHDFYLKLGRIWMCCAMTNCIETTRKWPERSDKLRSLKDSRGWHKTIFSTESCSHPTKNKRKKINKSQQKKSATVLEHMRTSFYTDEKATEKRERSLSFSPLWSDWLSTHNSWICGLHRSPTPIRSVVSPQSTVWLTPARWRKGPRLEPYRFLLPKPQF